MWTQYEDFAYSRIELFHGQTYRLYTDNPDLAFAGYVHITQHYIDTSGSINDSGYTASKGTSIGYGSE